MTQSASNPPVSTFCISQIMQATFLFSAKLYDTLCYTARIT